MKKTNEPQFAQIKRYLIVGYKHLSLSAKETYAILKLHDWKRGAPYPGINRIALMKGKSPQSTLKSIRELEKANLIKTKRRGQGKTNQYTLLEPEPDESYKRIEATLLAIKALRQGK